MLNELDIVMRENECPHIVQFYGALFKEVRFLRVENLFEMKLSILG